MKKIFTFCLALLALSSVPAMAQDDDEEEEIDNTLEFVDAQGNVVPDGSELTINTPEEDAFGDVQIPSGLYVNNTSEDEVYTGMEVNLSRLDNGSFNCCFPQVCTTFTGVKTDRTKGGSFAANEQKHSLATEWIPASKTSYGEAVAKLSICMYGVKYNRFGTPEAGDFLGYGPSVTITFVNPDPTGINSVNTNGSINKVSAIYNLRGEQLSHMQKGLNIVRYADGTTRKILK